MFSAASFSSNDEPAVRWVNGRHRLPSTTYLSHHLTPVVCRPPVPSTVAALRNFWRSAASWSVDALRALWRALSVGPAFGGEQRG